MSDPTRIPAPALPHVGWPRLLLRAGRIGLWLLGLAVLLGPPWLVERIRRGRPEALSRFGQRLVRRIERLGATYVKIGQMVASRADVLPVPVQQQLSRLFDDSTPMSARQFDRQWAGAVRRIPRLALLQLTGRRLGSGSVACVYEAVDPTGRRLAVKLQRPGVATTMAADLALLTGLTRLLEKLPRAGGAALADLMDYMNRALYGQIDFLREAAHTRLLADNLADLDGVLVPQVRTDLSDAEVLVTGFIEGLSLTAPAALAGPERTRAAQLALSAVGVMVFRDGFVHCDLHPGNLYVRADGSVVVLDAGYCVQVPEEIRDHLASFFRHLTEGDGTRCGEIMFDTALDLGPRPGREQFVAEIADLVARTTATGHRFELSEFGQGVFEAQNRYRVVPPSDFAFPLMSLMVAEGTLRTFWPDLQMPDAIAAA